MKKIERIEQGGSITVVHTEQLDQLESTIEELVGLLIDSIIDNINSNYAEISPRWLISKTHEVVLKLCENMERETIKYLETLTGKTWEELKRERK